MKIGIDVGGVISKYPSLFKTLIKELSKTKIEVFIISDMHPISKITDMLALNGIELPAGRVISADYQTHGELCKSVVCKELGIDILIDDFIGYVAEGEHLRLLAMPNPKMPYYSDDWKTDGSEGNFGRRPKPKV